MAETATAAPEEPDASARRSHPPAYGCCLTLLTSNSGTPVSDPLARTRTTLHSSTLAAKDTKKRNLAFQTMYSTGVS